MVTASIPPSAAVSAVPSASAAGSCGYAVACAQTSAMAVAIAVLVECMPFTLIDGSSGLWLDTREVRGVVRRASAVPARHFRISTQRSRAHDALLRIVLHVLRRHDPLGCDAF